MVEEKQFFPNLSPYSATHMENAASTLQPAASDIMHSPVPCTAAYPRPASVLKPLPTRPRSVSMPSTPDLPAELPGSILLENQGFPPCTVIGEVVDIRPVSHNFWTNTLPLDQAVEDEEEFSTLLALFPEPLIHSRSILELRRQHNEMRSARSNTALNATTVAKQSPLTLQHQSSSSPMKDQRHPRRSLVASQLSTNQSTANSTKTPRDNHTVAKTPAKPAQLSPLSLEGQTRTSNVDACESRRSEVCIIYFYGVVCFIRQTRCRA
jgi:hypothetical protein